ncbi:MAG: CoA-binding protein [Chloroflexi bacterium]|nr:CoA-binding protein [Chloroflexota bacterium]
MNHTANGPIQKILQENRVIAVVGLSRKPDRPSHGVARYLQEEGYRIIPVSPNISDTVLGEQTYPDLLSIPEPVDVVDIFRRSEDIPPVVEQAIRIGAKAVWMQLGIINEEAEEMARAAGLDVVMDHCMLVEHRKLRLSGALQAG